MTGARGTDKLTAKVTGPSPRGVADWLPWAMVIALPAVLWLVLVAIAIGSGSTYRPTGDTLLDRFITVSEQRLVHALYSLSDMTYYDNHAGSRIDLEDVRSWREEFSADPGYWELLAYHTSDGEYYFERIDVELRKICEQAREHDALSGTLALDYLLSYDRYWRKESLKNSSYYNATYGASILAQQRANRELMDQGDEESMTYQRSLEQLCAAAPDEALTWYIMAVIEAERENYSGAIDLLKKGNAAPRNTTMGGFPLDDWSVLAGSDWEPNRSYAFFCTVPYTEQPVFMLMRMREPVFCLVDTAAAADDREGLAAVHEFACRYALRPRARSWDASQCCQVLQRLVVAMGTKYPGQLTVTEQAALQELYQKLSQLQAAYQGMTQKTSFPTFLGGKQTSTLLLMGFDHVVTAGASTETEQYKEHNAAILAREATYETTIYPLLREIQRYDYRSLSFRDP